MVLEIAGGILLAFFIILGLCWFLFGDGWDNKGCGCALLIVIALVVFVYLIF